MSWTWSLRTADGSELDAPSEFADELSFTSQADAESWVGETWRALRDAGVDAVTLLDGDTEVYGPMSLHNQ